RDTGPIFQGHERCSLFTFNGWGGKYVLDHDDEVGEFVARGAGAEFVRYERVLEGGAIDWDGEGTVLTTSECLLNPNRNGKMTAAEYETFLRDTLGMKKVIWIARGLMTAHPAGLVDNPPPLTAPGAVVRQAPADKDDPTADRLNEIADTLGKQRDARGRMLQVIRIPSPGLVEGEEGE